jgi:hypothetical protein
VRSFGGRIGEALEMKSNQPVTLARKILAGAAGW